ncbi:unnamed protein product [Vicia faba]|uniref:AMP-activated protein kinase glycogen-binding domain-containing protein n=1 Tax=Vicia faba TaxID=3906 RepID=A0AAV0ZZX4_VICFA|nr:unnamed protein product [Vicia faba]
MGTTTTLRLCYFPNCFITHPCGSISNNCMFSSTQHHHTTISLPFSSSTHFHLLASQTNNAATATTTTRKSRKLKTDDEICSEIRQFIAEVGLPHDHIPSTKELILHGRNDLAKIVRRRGHKKIQDLLTGSLYGDVDSLNTANDSVDLLTGQNEKVDVLVDGVLASTVFPHEEGDSSGSAFVDSTLSLDECTSIPVESSTSSSVEDGVGKLKDYAEEVNSMAEGNLFPTELTTVDNDCSSSIEGLYPNSDSLPRSMPTEISGESPFETTLFVNSEREGTLMAKMVGDITYPLTVPSMENHSNTSFKDPDLDNGDKVSMEQKDGGVLEDISDVNLETSSNLSLEERVANFIQNGDLDAVEGGRPHKENNVMAPNGISLTSNQAILPGKLDQPLRDNHMPHEDPITHFDKDLDAEARNAQNQSEINHLKFMLHQKELELTRLKEQIEKEKHALSVLQTKAEEEISKAKKLLSEKDAELLEAEESLSGLKEVVIEFSGDGDVVEVAGSFNGWHHPIKMDPQPQPLSSVIDHGGSRSWSAMLLLYPGVYEIKFVVDGHWTTDPQRESVRRGHICNNILRVDR